MTVLRSIVPGALSGLLLVLSLPYPDWYPLAWFAMVPLLTALRPAVSPRSAVAAGYVAGLVYFGGTCYWITDTMITHGGMHVFAAWGVTVLFTIVHALYFAFFAWALRACVVRLGFRGLLVAPPLWVAIELVRTYIPFGGFPWLLSGYALVPYVGLLQIASWTGVYGLSFVAMAVNAAFACAAMKKSAVWAVGASATVAVLWMLPAPSDGESGDPLAVRMVQADIPLYGEWGTPESLRLLDDLAELSSIKEKREGMPRLIVWPETPAPFALNHDEEFRRRAVSIAQRSGAYFLLGYLDRTGEEPANSAALLDPEGRILSRYDKMHLVPFGEYVPMRKVFFFAGKVLDQVGDFVPGNNFTVSMIGSHRVSTAICYESIFPDLVREFAARGAELLVVITDDAWYGDSAAPFQHLRMGIVRAVENRRYVVRVANTGITAVVDPYGRVTARLPRNERTAIEGVVRFRSDRTFYTAYGDVFAYLNTVTVLAGGAVLAFRRRSQDSGAMLD